MIKTLFSPDLTEEALGQILSNFTEHESIQSILLLIGSNSFNQPAFQSLIKACPKPILGGVFPGIIHSGKLHEKGILAIGLKDEMKVDFLPLEAKINQGALEQLAKDLRVENGDSLFLFIDSMAQGKERMVHELFNLYGTEAHYLGGGTGTLDFLPFESLIHPGGFIGDGIVIGHVQKDIPMGVAHGWTSISKNLKVTEAEDNKVISINWEPAFEVYRSIVEEHSGEVFDDQNFFELSKSYPFGKLLIQAEHVVRDPYQTEGNSLLLVNSVAPGEFVQIMNGNTNDLLEATDRARMQVKSKCNEEPNFCIDCVSRMLFLADNFDAELQAMAGGNTLSGALTIGEIANRGENYLELFNKTIALARL